MRTLMVLAVLLLSAPGLAVEPPDAPAPSPEKATYLLVPIKGVIGGDFTARQMEALLDQAAKLKPTVVLLEIDTPGGSVDEAEAIVDLIIARKERRFVALVRRALSAGATITLACKEIYMAETATMGAATSFSADSSGKPIWLPPDVSEKHQSAWRAVCRKAAEHGGHPSVVADAMVDSGFLLTARKDGDKTILERNGKGEVIKPRGQVLTLTAREAVSCGLAKGLVDDVPSLGEKLGMPTWQLVGSLPRVPSAVPEDAALASLYQALQTKATALRLGDPTLTTLQKENAAADWKEWLAKERFVGQRVCWTMQLDDGSVDKARVEGYTLGNTVNRYYPSYPQDRDRNIAECQRDLQQAENSLRTGLGEYGDRLEGSGRARLQELIPLLTAALAKKKAEADYCLKVSTHAGGERRVTVLSWVHKSSTGEVAKIPKNGAVTLAGVIAQLDVQMGRGGVVFARVVLDRCTLASKEQGPSDPGKEQATPKVDKPPSEEELAERRLNMAANFKKNAMEAKAREVLQSILEDFPNTKAAKKAKKQLEGAE